jgi:predicted glycogen debranching enzyme
MVKALVRTLRWDGEAPRAPAALLEREWLVTNGLGGYASGTVSGAATRRYHGLLVAALPAPFGRWMMFNHLSEVFRLPGGSALQVGGAERAGGVLELHGSDRLAEFRLENGLPLWLYRLEGHAFEKRILLVHEQNTVVVHYRLVEGGGPVRLELRPAIHFRHHDAPVNEDLGRPYRLSAEEDRLELTQDGLRAPVLRLRLSGDRPAFTIEGKEFPEILYRVEESRGYDFRGDMWSPGYFGADLAPDRDVALTASTEPWEMMRALGPAEALGVETERRLRLIQRADPAARAGFGAELVLAADQFLTRPAGRTDEAARARAAGDEVRTVIAGYHWFTDWGRDTMISLPGLALATGRHAEAGNILRTFAHYVRDGLIPNLFPEGHSEGLYHTADATLWFFEAMARYVQVTQDHDTLRRLLPIFVDIVEHHLRGTRFGIHVDPADGLLVQGAPGYQLTWMDAKVGDWVATPRRGKAVEINALWYNALRHLEGWLRAAGDERADAIGGHAERARRSFNRRFWYAPGNYLYDVVDTEGGGVDTSCRPNQLLAIALRHSVLDRERWQPVMEVVRERLLTPVGLRSLAPGHADFKAKYYGDLRSRDAAYHQGTVWAWLIGPFTDSYLKVYPGDRAGARRFLEGFGRHLDEACVGSISEIFDAEEPYTPRGCVAQAWSVAEVLRCWVETAGG